MITKYNSSVELKPGMFVTLDTTMREGFAGNPARITKVTNASVAVDVYQAMKNQETQTIEYTSNDQDVTRRKASITWVCDTLEEAAHMHRASHDHVMATFEALKEMREKAIKAALSN